MIVLASGMFHLWAFSQRNGTFRQFLGVLPSFHSLLHSSSSLTSFFSCRSFLVCLRVCSFFFIFPHLLGRSSFLYNFDIALFEIFIEISSCQWLRLHPPLDVVCCFRQTRGCSYPKVICDVEDHFFSTRTVFH